MENKQRNWFAVSRSIIHSEIFIEKPDKWFKYWIYIIGNVNWNTNSDKDGYRRGEHHFTYKEICDATKGTRDSLKKFIIWAKWATMLTTTKTTRGMHIKVLNYDKYQPDKNDTGHNTGHRQGHTQAIRRPYAGHTIRKEGRRKKKEEEGETPLKRFLIPGIPTAPSPPDAPSRLLTSKETK